MYTVRLSRTGACLTGVSYSSYETMRASRGNAGYRMTYHNGVLWFTSPQFVNERGVRRLDGLIQAYAYVTKLDYELAGATTFKKGTSRSFKGYGKEGDSTYYLGTLASAIRHKDDLDLAVDPPPSLWIEVDNYGDSRGKLPLYAALGVPEVWRYRVRRRQLRIWRLDRGTYSEIHTSIALPGLTSAIMLDLLDEASRVGRPSWDKWLFEDWFPKNRSLFPDFDGRGH